MKIIGDHESLKNEILADAERKKEQAITKAEREARKIIDDAKKIADEDYRAIINHAKDTANDIAEKILGSIPQAVKRKKIEMFNTLVDNIMNEIYKKILFMKKEEAKEIDFKLLEETLKTLEQGEYVVYTHPDSKLTQKDLNELTKKYGSKCSLEHDANIQLGIRISQVGTKMYIDNTFDGKWKRELELIRYSAYEILFSRLMDK